MEFHLTGERLADTLILAIVCVLVVLDIGLISVARLILQYVKGRGEAGGC